MALVFGVDRLCPHCAGRGWTAPRNGTGIERRPAFPSELAAHARGERGGIAPCRSCGCTGIVDARRRDLGPLSRNFA